MGALAAFIEREFSGKRTPAKHKIETESAAKVANLAKAPPNFSNFSNFSRGATIKSAHWCACGSPASVAHGWFLRDQSRAQWLCAACLPKSEKEQ